MLNKQIVTVNESLIVVLVSGLESEIGTIQGSNFQELEFSFNFFDLEANCKDL